VFEKSVLRRIFGPKRDEIIRAWRKLHDEELHNSYSSPNIIRIIMSRKMKKGRNVACMGPKRNAWSGNHKEGTTEKT
jgi:hypothetical protein